MNTEKIVENIQKFCIMRGVKPTVACRESGAGRALLDNIKKGSFPSVEKIQQLAAYLGVTTSQLLGEAPFSTKEKALEEEELEVLIAYRGADDRARDMVRLALAPWFPQTKSKPEAM